MDDYIMTVAEASDYAAAAGTPIARVGIRKAARTGHIPGAKKVGRDWMIPLAGMDHYLGNRPKPGRQRGKNESGS